MNQSTVQFDPVRHQYSFQGTPYISATQAVARVSHQFDAEQQAIGMAERHGQTPEYWLAKWATHNKQATDSGTQFHNQKEEQLLSTQMEVYNGKVTKVQNPQLQQLIIGQQDIFYWPDGVYPEMLLYNHQYRVAGKADKVKLTTRHSGFRYAAIDDYKTNKEIKRNSFYDKLTGYRMLKHPLSHLQDCSHTHYSLQLSIYQFMLEELGFCKGARTVLHYPLLPEGLESFPGERTKRPRKYKLDYLREEVITLLTHIQTHEQSTKGPAQVQSGLP
jgi:ATP-dependent exoDNAse (exonuclease V) beta subunit